MTLDLESLRGHTPGPWTWWTSCSFRRLSAQGDGDVLCAVTQSDGHPDVHLKNGGWEGPDGRLIEIAPTLLAELTARRARDAEVEALVAADLELNRATDAAGGFASDGYEADSYGVYGSDFERCLACGAESGAGVLNKGVTHEADCVRHRYEVAIERRAAALLPFTGDKT